jgi:hypothetical protein
MKTDTEYQGDTLEETGWKRESARRTSVSANEGAVTVEGAVRAGWDAELA